jgi:alpha-tubulin suppressor-like RCC1 family protein
MEMFNLKENQYAIFTRDQKIISWHNEQALHLYPKMILSKIKNEISQLPLLLDYELPKIYTKDGDAWAKITNEGNVITGGDAFYGGDSNHVQFKLKNVKMVASTNTAFAALLENGNVVTWGNEDEGGKIPEPIENQLKNVKMLYSNLYAFAALLNDN